MAVSTTNAVSSASLTSAGMRIVRTSSALAPWAWQTWATTRRSVSSITAAACGEPSRVLIISVAWPGMTFWLLPPWNCVTVTTPDSSGDRRRPTTPCSAWTTAAPTKIGSMARSGREAWPPLPLMVTSYSELPPMLGPALANTRPSG